MADDVGGLSTAGPILAEVNAMYAPVDKFFHVTDEASQSVVGYAAPFGGSKPCAVELVVGDIVLAFSRSGRFSPEANAVGLRYGWCGFELAGLPLAVALDGPVVVRCAATQFVLHEFDRDGIAGMGQINLPSLSAIDLLRDLRLANGTVDLNHIAPFIIRFGSTHGTFDIVDTLYRYFFNRPVDDSGKKTWGERIDCGMTAIELANTLRRILGEEQSKLPLILQGPFEPGFPFGLELFA